ncbi:MAG: IclR family transcriptional regulator, partial [Methylobacteriaceae bacterium]|nr:IclR family transcriptional regulator [Methylobacteriaceae bacterium]
MIQARSGEESAAAPRAIARLLAIFDVIATKPEGMTLAELTAALNVPKSSLLALLRPLTNSGHLEHAFGRYMLGRQIYRLASHIVSTRKFGMIIKDILVDLAEESGETAILATLDRTAGSMTYVDVVESKNFIRYAVPAGVTRPIYCSAGGCCILAHQTDSWREEYLAKTSLIRLTPRTITDPTELRSRLAQIRREGRCVSIGEAVADAVGVGAPVFEADGSCSAALVIGALAD